MNSSEYLTFTQRLIEILEVDPRVLALVALGSMAMQDHRPDRWSDHDFFVITQPGEQEPFREDPAWLPNSEDIVLHFRETAHGVKVLYRSGHLLEYAVFDLSELKLARVNRYRLLFDKQHVRSAIEEVAVDTIRWREDQAGHPEHSFGQLLTNLVVGTGRYARGERMSARQFVKSYAVQHLLRLLVQYLRPTGKNQLDNLDPFRRFELCFPALGEELNAVLESPEPVCARLMLDLADREMGRCGIPGYPSEAVVAVRAYLLKIERSQRTAPTPWH